MAASLRVYAFNRVQGAIFGTRRLGPFAAEVEVDHAEHGFCSRKQLQVS